ncbi:acyl carrier protein [Parvularcula bermudensis HTCC2503]|uniref:Acyl carrier protein n=1 Tax=Parvularcula bermudensis (strain ATCC BAA-594 / HTCC2503 / KCTC 12087) TaxID=314260 RepID=E0TFE8_PARBH|nr:acyl carrier protein [Parvularcula bermudensis]ADM09549.1 acyl carrier protein [Parvularcula bermudensis HTCC2503]
MTRDELLNDVREIVASNIGVEAAEVTEQTSMENQELWDSVAHVDITFAIEEKYNIELGQEETEQMSSVAEIMKVLEPKVS